MHGGGHERGYRSGTINVPGIVGLGKASEISKNNLKDYENVLKLRKKLEEEICKIEGVTINGHKENRLPNTTNISIDGVDAEALIIKIRDEFAIASGSACTSAEVLASHVIMDMYNNEDKAYSSIRISLSKKTTRDLIKNELLKKGDYL